MCFTQNWVKGGLRAHTPCLSKRRARHHFVRSFDAKLRKGVRVYYCDLKILHPEILASKNEDDFLCKKVVKMDDSWMFAGFFARFLSLFTKQTETRGRYFWIFSVFISTKNKQDQKVCKNEFTEFSCFTCGFSSLLTGFLCRIASNKSNICSIVLRVRFWTNFFEKLCSRKKNIFHLFYSSILR